MLISDDFFLGIAQILGTWQLDQRLSERVLDLVYQKR